MLVAPHAVLRDARAIDDEALLKGAASVWAVVSFAADLPATPEQKDALGRARARFLQQAEALGLTETDIRRYLTGIGGANARCQPLRLVE